MINVKRYHKKKAKAVYDHESPGEETNYKIKQV